MAKKPVITPTMRTQIGDPPEIIDENDFVVKVIQNKGNTFEVEVMESDFARLKKTLPHIESRILVTALSPKLRNHFFVRRGGLALISVEQRGRLMGEIVNIVADKREWQTADFWPKELLAKSEEYVMDLPSEEEEDPLEEDPLEEDQPLGH